ncbi:PLP-dependent aminotransferase family protein [Yinghuangia sp. ASG 101]|uniref:MocR-like pyridoxine biosynthesis transcription factor PdxR n=1 Tax=Yinghuangia sp. ASG 101 TaxID=2896848 RepID=UPI001E3A0DEB|nr:PLP-dependent aminotransferase family protein [Yinghuangia sp. ASG 101]UGQ09402.1 PLP-dependent aminotransferase family protein [Yinghuangia sp. ASG 101]
MGDLLVGIDRAKGSVGAQITAGLRDAVRTGRLAPGDRLPSSRTLAADLGVSRGMVVEAYEQLVAEGYLTSRHGSGTRVADIPERRAPGGPEVPRDDDDGSALPYDLKPGTSDMSAFPRAAWLAATRHALATVPHSRLSYGDPGGVPELRTAIAAYLGRVRAAIASPDRIVVVGGVAQGVALIVQALATRGHTLLAIENPSSATQRGLLRSNGLPVVAVPVDGDGLDVDALARTGARAVLVTPAHQYPTGVVLSPERRAQLTSWARDVDGLVIEDDYDAEFRYDRDPVGCLQGLDPDRVVHLGSTSKALAPGMRLGWAVVPHTWLEQVRELKQYADLGSAVINQFAFVRLLETGGYDRHLRAMRLRYRSRRDAVADAFAEFLPEVRLDGIRAGLHLYAELPPGCREEAVVKAAAARGVRVEPVGPLREPGHEATPAVVLGYASLGEDRLREAVALLAEACREVGTGGA